MLVTSVGESEAASGAASEAARREASVAANGEASILASEAIRRDDNKAASAAYIGVAKREARGADVKQLEEQLVKQLEEQLVKQLEFQPMKQSVDHILPIITENLFLKLELKWNKNILR